MNDTYEAGAGSSASPAGLALDAELPPVQGVEGTDRTMLVVQYALAVDRRA